MPRYRRNGDIYEAIRYQPSRPSHIIHRLSEFGIPCVHLQPTTQAIIIFDPGATIAIQDPRHDFANCEGIIYPGDWIAWGHALELEVIPSRVFEERYRDAN